MDATPVPWCQVFARSERRASGTPRQVTLARGVARVRFDGLHDLLLIQPARDPMTGKPGPEHTRALVSVVVPSGFAHGTTTGRASAVVMVGDVMTDRAAVASVCVTIAHDSAGLFLDIAPYGEVSERTAALVRMRLILEAAEQRATVAA